MTKATVKRNEQFAKTGKFDLSAKIVEQARATIRKNLEALGYGE